MRNKGFTLIELLAVIVILAIIALIATPIILGIINDSRKSASEESAKLVVSNFELAYSTAYMKNQGKQPTLKQVCEAFNMDNAKCTPNGDDEATITVDIENVTCNVTGDETSTEGEGANAKTYSSKYLECKANDNTYTTKTVSLRKMSQ